MILAQTVFLLSLPKVGPPGHATSIARHLYSSSLDEGSSYLTPVKRLPVKCKRCLFRGSPTAPSLLSTLVSGAARRVRSKDVVKDPRQKIENLLKFLTRNSSSVTFLSLAQVQCTVPAQVQCTVHLQIQCICLRPLPKTRYGGAWSWR